MEGKTLAEFDAEKEKLDIPREEINASTESNNNSNDKFRDWNVDTLKDEVPTDENQKEENTSDNESNTYKES